MRTTRIFNTVFTALFIGVLAVTSMVAQSTDRRERKGDAKDRVERGMANLDLTDQQKEQIKALKEQFKAENTTTIEQMKALGAQAREQMQNGDKDAAKATREEMKTLRDALKVERKELREQISAILTDEQKAKLEEKRSEGREGKRKGRKNGSADRSGSATID